MIERNDYFLAEDHKEESIETEPDINEKNVPTKIFIARSLSDKTIEKIEEL